MLLPTYPLLKYMPYNLTSNSIKHSASIAGKVCKYCKFMFFLLFLHKTNSWYILSQNVETIYTTFLNYILKYRANEEAYRIILT